LEGIWIKRHIESLSPYVDQQIIHIQMDWGQSSVQRTGDANYTHIKASVSPKFWRLREWKMAEIIRHELVSREASKQYSHVNFHIAYPSLVHLWLLKQHLPGKILITEHWSEYHFGFRKEKKIKRIQNIFKKRIPLIVVSKQLGKDIENYSGTQLDYQIIPNAIDCSVFQNKELNTGSHFFTAAYWKTPKSPLALFEAILQSKKNNSPILLKVGGEGPLLAEMKQFVADNALQNEVHFLGLLSPEEMAHEMNSAKGFLMSSAFETFSVVSAEALCCGCPVIADNNGALPELINAYNGLVRKSEETWNDIIMRFDQIDFDRMRIAQESNAKFSSEKIGLDYYNTLLSL
jgi:L-malate glycosyltransferase